jgi:hypothetical protein
MVQPSKIRLHAASRSRFQRSHGTARQRIVFLYAPALLSEAMQHPDRSSGLDLQLCGGISTR